MSDLDNILQPANMGNNKNNKIDTKKRLESLKEMIQSDPVKLNTDDLVANPLDFPASQMTKYIDYDLQKKNHNEFAEQAISNIIQTYVKDSKLLDSPRLKDLKQTDILKYSRLLLLIQISEGNMLKLQEYIDAGDMSKEMFDSVNKAQQEFRNNMTALDAHLNKCEKYWKDYSELYGLESEEDKIVQESEIKTDDTDKRTIIDMSKLTEHIHDIMNQKKVDDREK